MGAHREGRRPPGRDSRGSPLAGRAWPAPPPPRRLSRALWAGGAKGKAAATKQKGAMTVDARRSKQGGTAASMGTWAGLFESLHRQGCGDRSYRQTSLSRWSPPQSAPVGGQACTSTELLSAMRGWHGNYSVRRYTYPRVKDGLGHQCCCCWRCSLLFRGASSPAAGPLPPQPSRLPNHLPPVVRPSNGRRWAGPSPRPRGRAAHVAWQFPPFPSRGAVAAGRRCLRSSLPHVAPPRRQPAASP